MFLGLPWKTVGFRDPQSPCSESHGVVKVTQNRLSLHNENDATVEHRTRLTPIRFYRGKWNEITRQDERKIRRNLELLHKNDNSQSEEHPCQVSSMIQDVVAEPGQQSEAKTECVEGDDRFECGVSSEGPWWQENDAQSAVRDFVTNVTQQCHDGACGRGTVFKNVWCKTAATSLVCSTRLHVQDKSGCRSTSKDKLELPQFSKQMLLQRTPMKELCTGRVI